MGFFYPEWPNIVRIDVTNPPTTTGYQVIVEIPWQPGMQDGFSDLRFSDYFRTLPYWIETSTTRSTATVWVKLTEINEAAREFFCYYGSGGASSESDGGAVFDFFDDFLGTSLDTNKWTGDTAYGFVSDSILTYQTGALPVNRSIRATQNAYGVNYCIETYAKLHNPSSHCFLGWGDAVWVPLNSVALYAQTATYLIHQVGGVYYVEDSNYTKDVYKRWTMGRNGSTNLRFYENGVELSRSPITSNFPTNNLYAMIEDADEASTVYVDWLAIRKYQASEPVCTPASYSINTAFYQGYLRAKGLITAAAGITLTAIQHLTHIDLSWSEVG